MELNRNGNFFTGLCKRTSYNVKQKICIENTVKKLLSNATSASSPGMLLGKIQSGKTRTFIGTAALGFDNGYDIIIILTKGTKALAQQTFQRLNKEFELFKQNDMLQIFDIMLLPNNLTRYELNQKIVLVVKKQKDNMIRLDKAFFETYPALANKRVLIIDDEADFASIGFKKTKEDVEINKIAGQIDELRKKLNHGDFLQVTATPYSLYLQPEDMTVENNDMHFKPIRPAFTELVPEGEGYIGGQYYFKESEDEESIASYIYEEVSADELNVLKKQDRRVFKIEESLTSKKIKGLRNSIINFIVGAILRRIQEEHKIKLPKKYSFIIHTESKKQAHGWQEEIVDTMVDMLTVEAENNTTIYTDLLTQVYTKLVESVNLINGYMPTFEDLKAEVTKALTDGYVMISKVNSEKDVNELLDESGQLRLRTPLNIFIGGQILDRGITIGNLIGFYYGRSPQTFQQDTVLQHSRMFGYRELEDLAVTRFYTTINIYDAMKKIHEFDTALRQAFEAGSQQDGVVFIQKDTNNRIIPCSPNKILLSSTTTLKPHKRMLPVGFQTGYKTYIAKIVNEIDKVLLDLGEREYGDEPFLIDVEQARYIIEKISETFAEFEEGYEWDVKAFISSLEYLSLNSENKAQKGKVWIIVRRDRNIKRKDLNDNFENSPDTPKGEKGETKIARQVAEDIPALMLLKQNGLEVNGWRGAEFWWPLLMTPKNTKTVIFASEAID